MEEGYISKINPNEVLNFDTSKLTKEKLEEYLNEIFNKNQELSGNYYREIDIGDNLLRIESGDKDRTLCIVVNKDSYHKA